MEYTKGFKYRIYPNEEQQKIINQTLGCARFVYNHFLAVRREGWQEKHESVTYVKSSRMLTELKCNLLWVSKYSYQESWHPQMDLPKVQYTP